MSPELIAILGVGVGVGVGVGIALAALMFHILRRMEERMRQDTQRSEERTRIAASQSLTKERFTSPGHPGSPRIADAARKSRGPQRILADEIFD